MNSIAKFRPLSNSFRQFVEAVNESQIDALYNKAKFAVKLAELYRPSDPKKPTGSELLNNISTIASLASNVFGIYIPRENRKILPEPIRQDLIHRGQVDVNNLNAIPKVTLLRYLQQTYPPQMVNQLNNQIKDTGTIHVNINKILQIHKDDVSRIKEIASTILHEAQHEWERSNTGTTSEVGPEAVERDFARWMNGPGANYLNQFLQQQGTASMASTPPLQPGFPTQ